MIAQPICRPIAIPARLHVFVRFMTKFMIIIVLFGGVVPTLHRRGINTVLRLEVQG